MFGVIFDLDGVLIDTSTVWHDVQNDVASELGLPPVSVEDFRRTFGQGTEADVAAFFPTSTVAEVDRLYHRFFRRRLDQVVVMDGALDLLAALGERGLRRAIATNTEKGLALDLVSTTELDRELDLVGSASEVSRSKPAPDLLLSILDRWKVGPDEVLYVGDAEFDEQAAGASRIEFIGFRRPGDRRVDALADVVAVVDQYCDSSSRGSSSPK